MTNQFIHDAFKKEISNYADHPNVRAKEHAEEAHKALNKDDFNGAATHLEFAKNWAHDHDRIKFSANLLSKSKNPDAVSHAKEALHQLVNNYDHVAAQKHLDLASMHHDGEIKSNPSLNNNRLKENSESDPLSMASNRHTKIEYSKTGEIYKSVKLSDSKVDTGESKTGIIPGKNGEEYEGISSVKPPKSTDLKERVMDKYKTLAEAAFGHLNNSSPFRSTPRLDNKIEEQALPSHTLPPYVHNAVKHFQKLHPDAEVTAHHDVNENGRKTGDHEIRVTHPLGPKYDDGDYDYEQHKYLVTQKDPHRAVHVGVETSEDGNLAIESGTKEKVEIPFSAPHKTIASSSKGSLKLPLSHEQPKNPNKSLKETASFRDISTNRNVALEYSIQEVMKKSYKKKEMMEDAMNVYIATPEQREDWLNVGRGAMDIGDYINKYKV
jgi:hypothetical protein